MEQRESIKIFIGCLPHDAKNEEVLGFLCQHVGCVEALKIRYRNNGLCAGYGHAVVSASNTEIKELLNSQISYKGRVLECRRFFAQVDFEQHLEELNQRRIYVSGLPIGFSDQELFNLFQETGQIEKAYMAAQDSSTAFEGSFGFVIFSSKKDAESVLSREIQVNGIDLIIRQAKFKEKKKRRRARLLSPQVSGEGHQHPSHNQREPVEFMIKSMMPKILKFTEKIEQNHSSGNIREQQDRTESRYFLARHSKTIHFETAISPGPFYL